jgi:hypothetical protein
MLALLVPARNTRAAGEPDDPAEPDDSSAA